MWEYSAGNRPAVVAYVFLSVGANVFWALEPLVVGFVLNAVQTEGVSAATLPKLLGLLGIFLLLDVVAWACHGPSRQREIKNAYRVKIAYKEHLLKGTMALPLSWHTDHHSGDTIDKIEKGAGALSSFSEGTFQIIQALILVVAGLGALFYFDRIAGIAVLVLLTPAFFLLSRFDRILVPGYKKVSLLENESSERVFDALSNITTIIILRVNALVFGALDAAIAKPVPQVSKNALVNEWKWFTASVLGRFAAVVVLALYLIQSVSAGTILIGTLYILYGYVDRIRGVFFQFAYLYNDIVRYRALVSNAELLSSDFMLSDESETANLPKEWKELQVRGLSFAYPAALPADADIEKHEKHSSGLKDVSLTIRHGERIALIGESGGGKSTFLKLLRDLYQPGTLALSVDDARCKAGFSSIADSISLIPQDPEIFSTTVRENITLGVEYPESHLKVFTDLARFTEVVERLPRGMESSMVEKGVNLSGGEKQRLALARGLLASEGKDIVLLDEPTSSVDFGNELAIYENIFEAFPGKTIISSVHRLHLLPLFDSVYLFKRGAIVASGSFDELRKASPAFQTLWKRYMRSSEIAGAE